MPSMIFLLLLGVATAFAGDSVGNGGGIAERNIVFAFQNVDSAIRLCLNSELCALNPKEKAILEKIAATLPQEGEADDLIKFESEKKRPGFFILNGEMKIAKTGSTVGEIIYFNLDLLYPLDAQGNPEPLGIGAAMSLLVHELGHHHGELDHQWLDLVGGKVAKVFYTRSQQLRGGKDFSNIEMILIDLGTSGREFTRLLLLDGENYFDLSADIAKAIHCDPMLGATTPVGARLWNVHWGGGVIVKNQFLRLRVTQNCQEAHGGLLKSEGYSQIQVLPEITVASGKPPQLTGKFEVREVICDSSPQLCW